MFTNKRPSPAAPAKDKRVPHPPPCQGSDELEAQVGNCVYEKPRRMRQVTGTVSYEGREKDEQAWGRAQLTSAPALEG